MPSHATQLSAPEVRRRKRLNRFGWALGCQASIAALLVGCYAVLSWWNAGFGASSARRGLEDNEWDIENKACDELEPFPDWEKNGGVILDFLGVTYIFVGVAIICDDYFVSALEDIVEILGIQPDVAGATFMAAGSSAPEVAMVIISTLILGEPDDAGLGNVVGAAIFNSMTITGLCALLSGYKVLPISPFPFARDTFYYVLAVVLLGVFVSDGKVEWWESFLLLFAYSTYILFMTQNTNIAIWLGKLGAQESSTKIGQIVSSGSRRLSQSYLEGLQERASSNGTPTDTPNSTPGHSAIDMPYPAEADAGIDLSGIAVSGRGGDTFPNNRPEVKAGVSVAEDSDDEDDDDIDEVPCRLSSSTVSPGTVLVECSVLSTCTPDKAKDKAKDKDFADLSLDLPGEISFVEASTQTDPPEKSGFSCGLILVVLRFPFEKLFQLTMPSCLEDMMDGNGKKRFFVWKFVVSIMWIAGLTYFVLLLATRICCILNIPSVLMGLVFLSAGTTVPDALSSILVSRQGEGDMAIANAVGSNIFNILFGIGLPWCLYSLIYGIAYTTPALQANVLAPIIILVIYVLILPGSFMLSGWKLYPKMGYFFIGCHIFFILLMILFSPIGGNPPVIIPPGGPM